MPLAWLLASVLVLLSVAPSSCTAPAAQPPPPDQATPQPVPTEAPPGEPVDPPELEPPAPGDPGVPTPDPSAPCCYTNPRWSGVCEVRPSRDETCASILEYLNNPRSAGKTYCGATDVRGGWEPVVCE
jgi:hypothetical protein